MPKFKYVVSLKKAHEQSGLSAYMVAKETGVNINTVDKYGSQDAIEVDRLNVAVAALAYFYGVDFNDAVKAVQIEDGESPENETPVAEVA